MILRQHKQNIKCGVPPVKHDLSVVLGYIRSQNSTRLTGKLWHAKGTMTLLPLSAPPPFEVASDTSAALFCDVEQGDETTLT